MENQKSLSSPLSVDSIEHYNAPTVLPLPAPQDPALKWIKTAIFLSYFDILALPRYAILPIVLLRSMGGPKYIFFIWPLWTLINFLIYFCLLLFDDSLSALVSSYEKYLPSPKIVVHMLWVWSSLDFLFSAASFVISIILLLYVSLDSDGTIAQGWRALYISMIVECIFCAFSIVIRLILLVGSCYSCFRRNVDLVEISTRGHSSTEITPTFTPEETIPPLQSTFFKYRSMIFLIMCGVLSFVSLILVSMCLQDYMKSTYYLTDSTTDTNHKGCDPMIQKTCLLPYPSSYYLQPSTSTASGYQVAIPSSAMPFTKRGVQITAKYSANFYDGFAVGSMILWAFDHHQSLDNSQLISYDSIPLSQHINSTTLLININKLSFHSHFSEKDFIDQNNDAMGYMMPSPSLHFNTTYVALVKGLKNQKQNQFLKSSDLTQDYLTAYLTSSTVIPPHLSNDKRYIRFQTIYFPLMEQLGINLTDTSDPIQIIWDFHTATHQSLTNIMNLSYNKTKEKIEKKIEKNEKMYELVREVHDNSCQGDGKMSKVDFYKINSPWYMKTHQVHHRSILSLISLYLSFLTSVCLSLSVSLSLCLSLDLCCSLSLCLSSERRIPLMPNYLKGIIRLN
jgi:hypothetical protein